MKLQDIARNAAAAEIFAVMASEEKSQEKLNQIKSMSDADIDFMANLQDIPESQLAIFRSLMRGEDNPLFEQLRQFQDQLKTGDLILVTGKSASSKALVASQKPFYLKATSSHIAVVHADFICVDAMPTSGVSNRLISEVLADVEDGWRIIRFNGLVLSCTEN